jgi:Sulfotransferase domain
MPQLAREFRDENLDLPTFIGVGPPRTGTTWLDNILRGHINLPAGTKETLFFDVRYARGMQWYSAHFRKRRPGLATGEFGPSYFSSVEARERIARHMPECKIICTVREPVDRLYSNYKMWRKLALVKDPFPRVAERHERLLSYTRYASNIAEWQRLFGRENTLVLVHHDARRDPQKYVDTLCSFIGAERLVLAERPQAGEAINSVERAPKNRRLARRARQLRGFLGDRRYWRTREMMHPVFEFCMGRGEQFPPLDPEFERHLRRRLEPEIAALEELLGRDLSVWRQPFGHAAAPHAAGPRYPEGKLRAGVAG